MSYTGGCYNQNFQVKAFKKFVKIFLQGLIKLVTMEFLPYIILKL
jgi:hypothetical protein